MSKGNTFENDLLKLIFTATGIANIADNASSAPLANLYVSLHTGDPGEAGNQESNECAYTDYARVAVARSGSDWTVTNNSVSPVADIEFPECGASSPESSEVATHWAVGTAASGSGKILYYGQITPNISIGPGVTPKLTTASTITED